MADLPAEPANRASLEVVVPPWRHASDFASTSAAQRMGAQPFHPLHRSWLRVGFIGLFLVLVLPLLQSIWTTNQAGVLLNHYIVTANTGDLSRAAALLDARASRSGRFWSGATNDAAFWRTYGSAASKSPSEEAFLRLVQARNEGRLDRIGQLWLGEVASATGHWGEAHDAYLRLDAVNLLIQRGADAQERGNRAEGRNWYKLAAAGIMASGRDDAANDIGRLSSAQPHQGDLLRAPGGRAISLLRVGRGFLSLGYPEEAVPVLEQAMSEMQVDPPGIMERQSIHLGLAEALAKVHPPGRHVDQATRDRVEHLVAQGLALGRSGNALVSAASTIWAAGMKHEAVSMNREAVRANPRMAAGYLGLGTMYEQLGYEYLALHVYRKGVQLVPDDARLMSELGTITLATTGPRQAIPILEKARTMDSTNVQLLTSLGDAYLALAQVREASRVYREALALAPYSKSLKTKLQQAAEARRTLS